ncbi:MAG TPA: 3-hydroxyacyl-CoA dehydrogenase NAD-binding domain-containing protein [Planctomycetota bacterium]|jgi:enoyl-CoA hydratase/3-hydroxyacyl-CoA dehydrogenase|nr:3-hydroxyacyl-CoA dehydrogenase [Planctomycetota bacterium]MDP7245022.1 3-hydroxyacyl-CoA dehydrogenase NAD-binding domain-containing protein [Planctomycetota bacterium]HJM40086.1 3-hydroxyacyl-CoA dehydrogenase NAD-binding domain-containing protein [Planctomycetota bacterium]|tara:strand:+ start:19427 stop:21472 length:2046 start_codon:yes stop_codon:yes gene_type:complete
MSAYNIRQYAVIGAGNMGSGIAQKIATEGHPVLLVDVNEDAANTGLERIRTLLQKGVERGVFKPEKVERILGNVTPTADWSQLADADIVIEAVFEDLEVKRDVFRRLGDVCKPDAILGTNTSSFLVKDVASVTTNPERVVGLHYFYHPAMNRLVEVIEHETTDPAAFDAAWAAQEAIGKTPIRSADAPGFVVNRYFVPWINESVRLLDEGVADIPTIEWAAKKCFGVGMGPFQLMNVTGVPISMHAANTLGHTLHGFYAPAKGLCDQVEKGEDWDFDGKADESKYNAIADRLMGVTFYVAAQLVHESVGSVEDTDIGARVGLRWPMGPFQMINKAGVERAAALAEAVVVSHGLEVPYLIANSGDRRIHISMVNYEESENLALVKFSRPDSLNALNVQVGLQLMTAIERARVSGKSGLVFQGTGKAFVAGADIKFFVDNLERNTFEPIYHFARVGHDCFRTMSGKRQPTIARVQGLCLGGGAELSGACDFVVCSPKASFGFPETGIGIIPGLGGTQRLPRRIGLPLAKWMIYTGQIVDANAAVEIGLADALVPFAELDATCAEFVKRGRQSGRTTPVTAPDTRWQSLWDFFSSYSVSDIMSGVVDTGGDAQVEKSVKRMSQKSYHALLAAEGMLNATVDMEIEAGLDMELDHLREVFLHPDALEGMKSLLEGRRPEFEAVTA